MKRILLIFLPLLLAACATKPDRVGLTDWQFSWHNQWYPASVPGFIHTDLMANGIISDPYYGANEDSVQWVYDERQWVYHTVVDRKALPSGDTVWFVFEGLAGPCEVEIRGRWKDTNDTSFVMWCQYFSDDMFIENAIDFEPIGDSFDITVRFLPLEDNDWSRGLRLKNVRYGIDLPERRAFTRMAPYQPGWDWGPKLQTCGIWKPVYITNQRSSNQSNQNIQNTPGIELRQEQDSIGQSFTFYRDGKPLFIKGANWIPVHSFPVLDSANRARYRHLLVSAKEAGFNMLRVWGGGIYEHDYFYDLCDSLGLMVWQDFIFAGTPYPDNGEMLNNIYREVHQQVSRIAKHPCVVLWCGNNEVKNGWEDWGWQGQFNWTPEQRTRLEKAMDTIFGYSSTSSNTSSTSILAQAVRDCDPLQRPYITTSPLYGWGHPECVTHGDSHYWGVWWGEEPFEKYAEKTGRFMSEYGFQSYPMLSSVRQFCPEDQLDIDSPTLKNHQKHGRGREIIDKAMMQYYGFDSKTLNLEDYCYVSQLLQAWGVGYGIYQHISQQPHCMGTLYWQLNDCWPVASWSSIDYYGNWKALHYRARELYNETTDLRKWEQYYSVYPKDRTYPEPRYTLDVDAGSASVTVTLTALTDLYDVYLETVPHLNGHFDMNFVDLKKGETLTSRFCPVDPKADVKKLEVRVKTLNEVMNR
jgi:beta-mannosidase